LGVRGISFDFWNTLFTEAPDGFGFYASRRHAALLGAAAEFGSVSEQDVERACEAEYKIHHSVWINEHRTLSAYERVSNCMTHLGVRIPKERLSELTRLCEEGILERPPIPIEGARETIEQLSRTHRLGIISDVGFSPGRVLRKVLADSGMINAFESLVFSDEAGHSKPHPEVFGITARRLEAAPEQMAHIGDLEHTDIVGAKRAGYQAIRFVGITPMTDEESTIADAVTSDLRRLPDLIRGL
jgi:FMN phosphatase YigB (HAD superfamily)